MDRVVFGGLHLMELEPTYRKLLQHLSSFKPTVNREKYWGGGGNEEGDRRRVSVVDEGRREACRNSLHVLNPQDQPSRGTLTAPELDTRIGSRGTFFTALPADYSH